MSQTSTAKTARSTSESDRAGAPPLLNGAHAPTRAQGKTSARSAREVLLFCGAELAVARSAFDCAVADGLAAAVPANTGSIQTLDEWHDRLLSGIEDGDEPIEPGKPWQLSASEIFLANWGHKKWGWATTRLERLADFWLGFDKTVRIVLVRSSLSDFVARQIRLVASMTELEERVREWHRFEAFAAALLEAHPDRVTQQLAGALRHDRDSSLAAFLSGLLVHHYGNQGTGDIGRSSQDDLTALKTAVDELLSLQHAEVQCAELNSSLAAALASAEAAHTSKQMLEAKIGEHQQQNHQLLAELAARGEVLRRTSIQRMDLEKEQTRLQALLLDAQTEAERMRSQASSASAMPPAGSSAIAAAPSVSQADEQLLAQLRSELETTRLHLFDAQAALQTQYMGASATPSLAPAIGAPPAEQTPLTVDPAASVEPMAELRIEEPGEGGSLVEAPLPERQLSEVGRGKQARAGLDCSRIIVQPCRPNSEYEALDVFCSDATFEDYRWPSLAFRIGAAAVTREGFSIHPRIEVSQQGPGKPFDSWIPETDTELGATFELRFQTDVKALDLNVWNELTTKDQALLITLLSAAIDATRQASSWPTRQRAKEQWLELLLAMAATFRVRLRGSPALQHLMD